MDLIGLNERRIQQGKMEIGFRKIGHLLRRTDKKRSRYRQSTELSTAFDDTVKLYEQLNETPGIRKSIELTDGLCTHVT